MTEADVQLAGAQTIREAIAVMDLLPRNPMPLDLNLTVSLPQEQLDQLTRIEDAIHQLQGAIMTTQEDIDAATAQLGVDSAALNDAAARIEAEIATLEGQGVNTQPLKDALAALDTSVGSVGNIVPVPAPAAFVTKTQEDVDAPDPFVHYSERLFAYNGDPANANNQVPTDQQFGEDRRTEWEALPVG